jgi:hypothetical protein
MLPIAERKSFGHSRQIASGAADPDLRRDTPTGLIGGAVRCPTGSGNMAVRAAWHFLSDVKFLLLGPSPRYRC